MDDVSYDAKVRASLYRIRSIVELKEELLLMERAEKKSVVKKNSVQREPRLERGVRKCYSCGKQGHRAQDCSTKSRLFVPNTNERTPVKCFRCGGEGHFGRNYDKNSYCVMGGQACVKSTE